LASPAFSDNLTSIFLNLVASVIYGIVAGALNWLRERHLTTNPRRRWVLPILLVTWWVGFNFLYIIFVARYSYTALVISTAISAWLVAKFVNQFWRIGLVGADFETRTGIDYLKALKLCSNSLNFLGIGAAKLTQHQDAFTQAIDRCDRPGNPIRFLLCNPASSSLEKIARKAGKGDNDYKDRVRNSLQVIADLRNNRAKNIEVRFYKQFPTFRLMFIDDDLCLTSHYILGKDAGDQLPQLHIVRGSGVRDINSLYYGFRSYFDDIWEEAEPWDFKTYLGV
jgi:Domain of unknown function (DUF5919)